MPLRRVPRRCAGACVGSAYMHEPRANEPTQTLDKTRLGRRQQQRGSDDNVAAGSRHPHVQHLVEVAGHHGGHLCQLLEIEKAAGRGGGREGTRGEVGRQEGEAARWGAPRL